MTYSNGLHVSYLQCYAWCAVLLNGFGCKDPKMVNASDFSSSGLHITGNTSNPVGSRVTPMTATQIPGLNSLDISLVHIDYAPWGINPPHSHPRATEILTVLEGSLEVGFVTSNPQNRLITKVLQKGDVFVFPIGLIHHQRNVDNGNAFAIAVLRALALENSNAILFYNSKKSFYYYIIPFYNISISQTSTSLFYSLK